MPERLKFSRSLQLAIRIVNEQVLDHDTVWQKPEIPEDFIGWDEINPNDVEIDGDYISRVVGFYVKGRKRPLVSVALAGERRQTASGVRNYWNVAWVTYYLDWTRDRGSTRTYRFTITTGLAIAEPVE